MPGQPDVLHVPPMPTVSPTSHGAVSLAAIHLLCSKLAKLRGACLAVILADALARCWLGRRAVLLHHILNIQLACTITGTSACCWMVWQPCNCHSVS